MSVPTTPPIETKNGDGEANEAPRKVELPYNFEKELIENQNRHFCGHYTFVPCTIIEPLATKFYARHDRNTLDEEKFTKFVRQYGRRRARGILPRLSGEVYGWLPAAVGESVKELNFICAPKIRTNMTIHGERVVSERVTERPPFNGPRFIV
ncbi:PREDICTED: uncharacterized protein LOC108971295 [Bactrocera latifrons]|uniref:uncharacterized protein LOC108971295 n=1 Tax=Bactrocera latifrons TaxID=174628 RepID=UPI0008DE5925|nr:PREDICTED: uncharacterized protein LOC108971295 [Bactrocera latifrons]